MDIVKDVVPTVEKYVKYQICHNDYVNEFKEMQTKLKRKRKDVEEELLTQLMQRRKIAKKEVEAWLKEADQETAENVAEDLICRGFFSIIRSSRKLDKKTQSLKEGIFKQGEKYTNPGESLVIDDHSIERGATEFKETQEQLKLRQKDIKAKLETWLLQPGKMASNEVKDWMEKAGKQIDIKVEDLISQGECSSPSNLWKKIEELSQILEQGKAFTNAGVILVIDDHSIKGFPLSVEKCSGRDDIQEKIQEWLKGDKVTRIAVYGMGGVGKTTIMKNVHNQLLNESKFNKVIWVKVSKDFDIIVQQKKKFDILRFKKKIASSLKLEQEPKDPENETKLVGLISKRLVQDNFLLILDDVWEPFSLEDVGIPNGCKLVLTTRSQDVARVMECKVISVDPFPPIEALALFLEKVGSEVLSNGRIKRDIEPVLKQILQKCGGVPLAIVTVAKTMRGKLDPRSWKWALAKLIKFKGIVDCLKFSYECLESQCQECFLYCALYPEDYEIPREELIECWIEDGFIYKEGETRDKMNCEGHVMLEKLVDNCLLELVKNYGRDCVTMHDLFRDMALEISSQFLVKAGVALQKLPDEHEWREDLLKVSLMQNHITEIPSSMPSPKCPMLTTLLLSNNKISTIPEAFFEHMLGLKILDLSNNRELSRLPTSVSKLEKLTTLLLVHCESLSEVPSLSNLVGLKKLDLSWTSIEELPQGLNMLTNLKYLCLGGRLSGILDKLLQNLSKLQYLIVSSTTKFKCEKIGSWGKLQSLEKLVLGNLDNLDVVFGETRTVAKSAPLPVGTFSSLQFITVFECVKIRKLFSVRWLGYLQNLQTIDVNACEQLEEIIGSESEEGEKVTLPNLESLKLTRLPQLKSIYSGSLICDSIKKIEISDCENIESVFWLGFNPLPNLEYLKLTHLDNLKCVFDGEGLGLSPLVHLTSFFSLKEIRVKECHHLKKVFSSGGLLRYFQSLEYIEVEWCSQMEELISSSTHEEEKVTLPNLESLKLTLLPQWKSIYRSSLICDSVKKIEIYSCKNIGSVFWLGFNPLPNLEYLNLAHLDNLKCVFDGEDLGLSPLVPLTSFFSLKEIRVKKCHHLKKVFSSGWLLHYFQSLEYIEVEWCSQMEELISSSAHEEEKVTLPNLESLKLTLLPQLKSIYRSSLICDSIKKIEIYSCKNIESVFWSGFNPLPNLEYLDLFYLENLKAVFDEGGLGLSPLVPLTSFFSLKRIRVSWCDQLKKVFSSGWLFRYFQSLETINVRMCSQMEELISSSAHEEEEVTLPKLQSLQLIVLPALKSICGGSHVLICDSIQSLRISECKKLKRIPLNFPQSSHPPSFKEIVVFPKEWWESLEWDHPNAKEILLPFCQFRPIRW